LAIPQLRGTSPGSSKKQGVPLSLAAAGRAEGALVPGLKPNELWVQAKIEFRRTQDMTCPFCGHREDKVIDSRESKEGESIRRRRQCLACERRFTTYERCDEVPYMVIKKDGRREKFDRQKVLNGLLRACEKRPVSMGKLAELVDDIESSLLESPERELPTTLLGERLMERLKTLDKIAYVRFASVYRDFQDLEEFLSELKNVMLHRKV
jgi:transcriptional repressor NrdR